MQVLATEYTGETPLVNFLQQHALFDKSGLVQIYVGHEANQALFDLLDLVVELLPDFKVIGCSTAGEIIHGRCCSGAIVLTFLQTEKLSVDTFYSATLSFDAGQQLARGLQKDKRQMAFMYGNSLHANPELFIRGFHCEAEDICLVGGNAADNKVFRNTFVIHGRLIATEGVVGAVLSGEKLGMDIHFFMNWKPIGHAMQVTRVEDNVLYELDGIPVTEVYKKYFGSEFVNGFPETVIEFPLIIERQGFQIARAPVALLRKDNAIAYAGSFLPGDHVFFSVADIREIDRYRTAITSSENSACFIFSCAARKSFLRDKITQEIGSLDGGSNGHGCFTYGEYLCVDGQAELFNISTVFVAITDNARSKKSMLLKKQLSETGDSDKVPDKLSLLSHLAGVTGEELHRNMQFLEQYKAALDKTAIVSIADPQGNITYVNKLFEEISGYSAAEVLGKNHRILRHPDMQPKVFESLWKTISERRTWRGLIKNRRKDGSYYFVNTTIVPVLNVSGEIKEFVSIRTDVTKIIKAQTQIRAQLHDALTGLPNRIRLLKEIAERDIGQIALMDVRNFKILNDFWGFEMGDLFIQLLSRSLINLADRFNFHLYRLSGAIFALLPKQVMPESRLCEQLDKIKSEVENVPLCVGEYDTDVQLSVGVGLGEQNPLALAESALNEAKETDGDASLILRREEDHSVDAFYWINEVRNALSEGRVLAHFQLIRPVSEDHTQRKYETLVRLQLKDGSIVSPAAFLPFVKRTRLYSQITRLMVQQAIEASRHLQCSVSVNLTVKDIVNQGLMEEIMALLDAGDGNRIIFELTESEAIVDFIPVRRFIESVRKAGARVAIDDFGSGYSNFSYLVEIKPDYIKIDGSIISKIMTSEQSFLVTQGIIDLSRKIGAKVIAEFVSDKAIFDRVKTSGVDFVQGYHIGHPQTMQAAHSGQRDTNQLSPADS
ncbi:EAL domain-containing protein [Lacimicrobium alkaliphilum]|uniref:Diguanylate cyclase n=1 Tax=Lacimicrobium alkaliphilum TaxID=1526571 RepID=A0A0U2QN37_9ALTE|nr:EAL domain-containing protein [Lacimicrobium alkaliphilum]ALS98955.1 hypothetical protein AT746_12200 [Lacimicrobium alkaliphilum]